MPIYEYRCTSCGERFDKLVRASTRPEDIACPRCSEHAAERQLSVFASLGASSRSGSTSTSSSSCGSGFT